MLLGFNSKTLEYCKVTNFHFSDDNYNLSYDAFEMSVLAILLKKCISPLISLLSRSLISNAKKS